MIHWLIQTSDTHPDLERGIPPGDLLDAVESERFAALKVDKRRRDWLLGRWTAKHLLRSMMNSTIPLSDIPIRSREDGSPYSPQFPALSLSISHARERAFCAAAADAVIGADIETIEPRNPVFIDDYFTGDEQRIVARAADRDTIVTAIWSAKEAASKAVRMGLRLDTRTINCLIEPGAAREWTPFHIEFDSRTLDRVAPASGWWRAAEGFVLTLVALDTEVTA